MIDPEAGESEGHGRRSGAKKITQDLVEGVDENGAMVMAIEGNIGEELRGKSE